MSFVIALCSSAIRLALTVSLSLSLSLGTGKLTEGNLMKCRRVHAIGQVSYPGGSSRDKLRCCGLVHIYLYCFPKKRCCLNLFISFLHYFVSFLLGEQKVSQCGSTNEGVWRQKIWSMEGTGWSQSPDLPQEKPVDQTLNQLCHYTQECRGWRCQLWGCFW